MMANLIALAIIVLAVYGASVYIYKSRKRGVKCIGCPSSSSCSHNCSSCNGSCHTSKYN